MITQKSLFLNEFRLLSDVAMSLNIHDKGLMPALLEQGFSVINSKKRIKGPTFHEIDGIKTAILNEIFKYRQADEVTNG